MEGKQVNNGPLTAREFGSLVTVTNRRTHVINLYGDGQGEAAIHLIPGVPTQVPDHYLSHKLVKRLIADGGLEKGSASAIPAAKAAVDGVDFNNPEGTKAARAARKAAAGGQGTGEATGEAAGGEGGAGGSGDAGNGTGTRTGEEEEEVLDPPPPEQPAAKGGVKKPWEK